MKKLVTVLLALLLCMIISAAIAEIPSEAEILELNHKIWEANFFDDVISRHENYTIHWIYDYISGDQTVYQTKEERYTEWSSGEMEYDRSDHFGCYVYPDMDSGKADVSAYVDVGSFRLHLQASPEEELDSFVYEHDTITDIVYKDNLIYIYSQYDEELAKTFFEQWYHTENPGMIVTTEFIVDAESFEEVAVYYRGEKDGETVVLAHVLFEYDVQEPSACRILRALLESESPNMRTCRYTVQPDTDEEKTYEIILPVNFPCKLYASGIDTLAVFSDREATQYIAPDSLTDSIYYVFFNPDEELLERSKTLMQR